MFKILIIGILIMSTFGNNISYMHENLHVMQNIQENATQQLKDVISRMTLVVNTVAASILAIFWIYEGLFLFFHKDDREGLMKFKHDLPIMLLASFIVLGASTIVNIISFIASG
ncbi:MAG: hypothetical protein ACP5RZ_04350 [Thermoplasmata archaeon]